MRLDNSNNSLLCLNRRSRKAPPVSAFQVDSGPSLGAAGRGPAARLATSAARLCGRGRLVAPRRDRPIEHAVEIEIGRFLDAVRRRIGPGADQPLGIAAVGDQQAANALEELERLDDDDFLGLVERVVAVDEIGQMPGEIGDDVATRLGRRPSAHGSSLSLSADGAAESGPAFALRHYQPDRRLDKRVSPTPASRGAPGAKRRMMIVSPHAKLKEAATRCRTTRR